jgi:amidase
MEFSEYLKLDATALAALVANKSVSPKELVQTAIARIESVDPKIHSVIHRRFARVLDEAEKMQSALSAQDGVAGPFAGVPFLVKDLDGTLANEPYNGGTRALAGYVAPTDSEHFARFKRAGVLIVGKTNTPELGLVAYTEPELHGPTRNPWNLAHTPGGSSGGSAAAVAAGIVPMAHAGDGGGSIRIPASACGLFGMKPSRGRMPMGPDESESWHAFVSRHVVSRSVRDSAAMLDATHGPDETSTYTAPPPARPYLDELKQPPKKLRIAYTSRSLMGSSTHRDCVQALEQSMKLCESLGHDVYEDCPTINSQALRAAYLTIVCACTADAIDQIAALTGRAAQPAQYEPVTWFLAQCGRAMSAAELENARTLVAKTSREIARFFRNIDVFATPTLAYPPVKIGELHPKPWEMAGMAVMRGAPIGPVLKQSLFALAENSFEKTPNTMLFNMTGQPAMSVPLFVNSQHLPIGTQFVGRYGDESTLFALAGQLEQAQPFITQYSGI